MAASSRKLATEWRKNGYRSPQSVVGDEEEPMKAVGPRRGALLGLVLLVALFGAGCGGGDDDGDQAGDQQGTGGAAQLENPITPGTLTVGTELPAPPFWIGDDYDSITGGFEVDLAKEIGKRLGLNNVKFVEMPFSGLVAGQQCDCDINFSQVTITEERDRVVDFTEPYFEANQGILARQGVTVTSLADAKGIRWGAQLNTTGATFIADRIQPTTEARIFDRTVDAFQALNAGQIDAILLDTPIVLGAVDNKQVRNAEVIGQFKTGEQYGAVLNRGSPNLEAFNTVIRQLKSEGFVDQLLQKYFPEQVAVKVIEG
jgi:polar amino acid transport system substrate-binding protein